MDIELNILQIIEDRCEFIIREYYKKEKKEDLNVIISRLCNGDRDEIIITLIHHQHKVSDVLFPVQNEHYGLNNLDSYIKNLYNQTM